MSHAPPGMAMPVTDTSAPVLSARGLRKTFDKREVLRELDWSVPPGRVIGLLGRNGAGKTTLLRCLSASAIVLTLPFGIGTWLAARREYLGRPPRFDVPIG